MTTVASAAFPTVSEGVPTPSVATLIGDVVDSREAPDRQVLHEHLVRGLALSSAAVPGLQPLDVTAGDEFQAVYPDVGTAVLASLHVRLVLAPAVDVRFGIGHGPIQVLDADRRPVLQDGPGWWAARQAIEEAAALQARPATRTTRARFVAATPGEGPPPAWVNAVLAARDLAVARLSERSARLLLGGLSDRTQILMAQDEGISQSAVSQAFTRDGLGVLLDLHRSLSDRS